MSEAQYMIQVDEVQMNKHGRDNLAQTAPRTQNNDKLSIWINNVKIYCSLIIQQEQIDKSYLKSTLLEQLQNLISQKSITDFRILVDNPKTQIFSYPLYQNLSDFQQVCREFITVKNQAETKQDQQQALLLFKDFLDKIKLILEDPQNVIEKLNNYKVYENDYEKKSTIAKQNKQNHFHKELINTKIDFDASVFSWVKPSRHQVYMSEASKIYNQIAPIRIKSIVPNSTQTPTINIKNYFKDSIEQSKAVLAYCIPGTKNIGYYQLSDLCKLITMQPQFYQQKTLTNDWQFSQYTKSVVTPDGKIFAINCRTTKQKIDNCMFEITDVKASNRGPLPNPKRQSSFIYLNGYLYVIGGYGEGQKCSKKNYRYNLKEKKWVTIAESNVALKKPTLCSLNNRYLLKVGGLNQFEYINKVIEIYDPLTDKWSLVRANPKNILEEVSILQDSLAVQINDDQVYVFGGKNGNKFSSDKGFILEIQQIKERRKGAAKVTGQLWNVSIGKRNILTLFGSYSPSNVVIHFNNIYLLRVKYTQALSI